MFGNLAETLAVDRRLPHSHAAMLPSVSVEERHNSRLRNINPFSREHCVCHVVNLEPSVGRATLRITVVDGHYYPRVGEVCQTFWHPKGSHKVQPFLGLARDGQLNYAGQSGLLVLKLTETTCG